MVLDYMDCDLNGLQEKLHNKMDLGTVGPLSGTLGMLLPYLCLLFFPCKPFISTRIVYQQSSEQVLSSRVWNSNLKLKVVLTVTK